jgi:hypothetical protein
MTQQMPTPASRDDFEEWLASLWVWLEPFCEELKSLGMPSEVSIGSLDALEGYLLRKYETMADIMEQPDGPKYLNKFAIFIGEAIRKASPTPLKWKLVDDNPKDAFYGLPVVVLPNPRPICPQTLVTAALDRRTGKFLFASIRGEMSP